MDGACVARPLVTLAVMGAPGATTMSASGSGAIGPAGGGFSNTPGQQVAGQGAGE